MQKENRSLEYKEEISRTYLKTVSAFANYNDGEIIFGITDDYRVVGVPDPEKACLDIETQINDSIRPQPDFSLKVNGDGTVSLLVKRGNHTPYRYKGKAYKRNDSATIEVDDIEEKRLVLSGMNVSFDELSCGEDDLKFTFLEKKFSEMLGIDALTLDIMKSLGLYDSKTGYNNGAKLLADTNDFPGVDIVVFGDTINTFRKRFTFSGESVLKQYFDGLEVYKNEYIVEEIKGGFREKVELIPFEAYREALANALVHRTWDIGANAKVEMHPNEIIISSPGGLMGDMTKEDYVRGNFSSLRNPVVANVFRRLNIIEAFATGIRRINEAYKEAVVKPIYEVTDSSISVTLPLLRKIEVSPNERKVLDSMREQRIYTRVEIEALSGFSKDTLIRILNSLIGKGLIEKSGKAKSVYYGRR